MYRQRGYVDLKGLVPGLLAIGLAVGSVVGGFVLYVAIPWAWPFVRSYIHTVTA